MKFAREKYATELVAEMRPLWQVHAQETLDVHPMPLNPDLEMYARMELLGVLRAYTMRLAGVLAGYQVVFVTPHHHSMNVLTAQMDILFLRPEYRKGLAAYKFITWCDLQLRNEGVQITIKAIKARLDFGRLLERIGYMKEDVTYSRRLWEAV